MMTECNRSVKNFKKIHHFWHELVVYQSKIRDIGVRMMEITYYHYLIIVLYINIRFQAIFTASQCTWFVWIQSSILLSTQSSITSFSKELRNYSWGSKMKLTSLLRRLIQLLSRWWIIHVKQIKWQQQKIKRNIKYHLNSLSTYHHVLILSNACKNPTLPGW